MAAASRCIAMHRGGTAFARREKANRAKLPQKPLLLCVSYNVSFIDQGHCVIMAIRSAYTVRTLQRNTSVRTHRDATQCNAMQRDATRGETRRDESSRKEARRWREVVSYFRSPAISSCVFTSMPSRGSNLSFDFYLRERLCCILASRCMMAFLISPLSIVLSGEFWRQAQSWGWPQVILTVLLARHFRFFRDVLTRWKKNDLLGKRRLRGI